MSVAKSRAIGALAVDDRGRRLREAIPLNAPTLRHRELNARRKVMGRLE
jgi:hypothetical protein